MKFYVNRDVVLEALIKGSICSKCPLMRHCSWDDCRETFEEYLVHSDEIEIKLV